MTTKSTFEKFDAAFDGVSAYAIMKDGEYIGKVCVKHSKAGVCTVFVHEHGFNMITGKAGGYGYDKAGAALQNAYSSMDNGESESELYKALQNVTYNGEWQSDLRKVGFVVQFVI